MVDYNYKKIISEYDSYIGLSLDIYKNEQWIDDRIDHLSETS